MPDPDLRQSIKEMLVKNLMLQTTAAEIGDDLPLFGPGGLGLDSIDALELVVSMEKTFGVGVPKFGGGREGAEKREHDPRLYRREARSRSLSGIRGVDGVDQLTKAAEAAPVRSQNQTRQIPDFRLVFFRA
jgi:Acyl carrier protein